MISVIIPVYNMAPYIERCVESILHQTYSDLEVITIDYGSTDDSGAICERLARSDERIVVIHKENGGNANARNTGIDAAKGDFLSFIDADDYIENNMYEEMLAEMNDSSISIVCCGFIITDVAGKEHIAVSKEKRTFTTEEALYDFFTRKGTVSPSASNKLFRREIFDKGARFNDAVIHEDTEAMPRFLDAAENVLVMDRAFYHYIKRKESLSTSKYFSLKGYRILDSMKEYEEMCKKKYPSILPYVCYYDMMTTQGMLINLSGCIDARRYIRQGISIRCRMIKAAFKCMRWGSVRKKYADQIKIVFVRAVLGVRLTELMGGICSRLKHS